MTEVCNLGYNLPVESHACLHYLPGIQQLRVPIDRLDGGHTGAQVWQFQMRREGRNQDEVGILKIGHAESISEEIQHHRSAEKTEDHPPMPELLSEGAAVNEWKALIFSVAPDELASAKPLSRLEPSYGTIKAIRALAGDLALWYSRSLPKRSEGFEYMRLVHVKALKNNLNCFERIGREMDIDLTNGQICFEVKTGDTVLLPNPLRAIYHSDVFTGKHFTAPFGQIHGDIHLENIMVSLQDNKKVMLIDFAHFRHEGSILHDIAYLEISLALMYISRYLNEGRVLWDTFFKADRFGIEPDNLPAVLKGLWLQRSYLVNDLLKRIAGSNKDIRYLYKIAYLHAIASSALRWFRFEDIELEDRYRMLYVAARALHNLALHEFINRQAGFSTIEWLP